ncbi:hypothetical protein FOXG_21160 [Fusarium oxysporum f. sp. lycopersici 4287]|uniref:Xylanolytic transcriptional activator regulatory domain-containing protein n=1 Tax=Fusarium oxysporum f. sp. lycopersici (strain 4287 / CBS 123668 / FGSC 9935 / NRRL 34936) TaxID=426428 RepID=A0A0J9VUS6_FUSO4|nr:hypothetical protein FOXG_21160 [Fusarium oxysporum f. sp. lycopersici 4287]KNB14583.1 hypothetical protein FOXG_21160 [Fusarium oxysporum f. sp. lycopersici 4287]
MNGSPQRTPNIPRYPNAPRTEAAATQPPDLKSILRVRQLARIRKACLPCRERKPRASSSPTPQPHQPELQARTESSHRSNNATHHGRPVSRNGSVSNTSPSLLGDNSIISVAKPDTTQPHSNNERRTAFETGILPLLGMDGASDVGRGTSAGHSETTLALDQDMISLFGFYRDRVHSFQFVIDDLAEIEKLICSLLNREIQVQHIDNHSLCLLHAIMAAGAQFSDLPTATRLSKSNQNLHASLKCLGSFDLLWNPSKRLIQALLILGHVLQNDMNPRAAWILGGTTVRVALSVGLHQSMNHCSLRLSPAEAQQLRQVRASGKPLAPVSNIVWQDALLSLAFDRPPASHEMNLESDLPALISLDPSSQPLDYRQAMNWLCHLSFRHLPRLPQTEPVRNYSLLFHDFDLYESSLAPHLQDLQRCTSIQELQEHYSLIVHRYFLLSTLCRPILSSQNKGKFSGEECSMILNRFQGALKRSVCAFIKLRSISNLATRSWAFVHNGLASALLLSFIRQGSDAQVQDSQEILAELVKTLTERSDDVGQFSAAHKKALRAIQALQRSSVEETRCQSENSSQEHHPVAGSSESMTVLPEHFGNTQEQSMVSLDDWLRDFDFDAFSPLESYNFIMSDQVPHDFGL